MDDRVSAVQEFLSRMEVDLVGVASLADADPRLRDQALSLLPGARTVVALASEVFVEILDHSKPDKIVGEGTPGDMFGPHLDYLNGRLTRGAYDVAKACHRQGFKALPMPAANYPVDRRYLLSVLSYKHVAEAAGLGKIGWHSLLVTPQYGSRVRLACVLTEAELTPSKPLSGDLCDGCGICVQDCPVGALSQPNNGEPYAINKFACSVFRGGSGACSECMRVCPKGR